MKKVMAGIDLHSNNVVIGVMDSDGKRVASQKLPCELKAVAQYLAPYKKRLRQVAVESTFNWYWLVDGLQAAGYPVVLANPAKMDQYSGIKHADDTNDAFFLADLQRLNILPTGYIYDRELRPVRDLLRRRLSLVHQRSALMISFKSLFTRTTGQEMKLSRLKALEPAEAEALYEHPANQLIARVQSLMLTVNTPAKIVINERTGTIVLGGSVKLLPVSVIHGSLSIQVVTTYAVVPGGMMPGQKTPTPATLVPETRLNVNEAPAQSMRLDEGANVEELVNGLHAIGTTARDVVAILQAIKAEGGIQAELEIQ